MNLLAENGTLHLTVADNGRGLPDIPEGEAARTSMGMTGMRARARSIGGELTVKSSGGLSIDVSLQLATPFVPQTHVHLDEKDPHPVGR